MSEEEIWENEVIFQSMNADLLDGVGASDVRITDVVEASSVRKLGAAAQRKLDENLTWIINYVILNLDSEESANAIVADILTFTTESVQEAITNTINSCDVLEEQLAEQGIEFDSSTCGAVTEQFETISVEDVADSDTVGVEEEDPIFSDAPTMAPTASPTHPP